MSCDDTRRLLNAYIDGELDLVRSLEIEQHLQSCATCSQIWKNQQVLKASFTETSLYFKPPAHLQARVQASIREGGKANPAPRTIPWRLFAFAAALVLAVVIVSMLARSLSPSPENDRLAQEVVASHVRSLMANHLSDIASSDKHTVKPWFDGKLDFSPPVDDFASEGFPLIGGRLDYLDNRPVAALVYGRQKHFINLFIWPLTGSLSQVASKETLQGYNVFHWSAASMDYWAVSDLNRSELQQFVQLVQNSATRTPSP